MNSLIHIFHYVWLLKCWTVYIIPLTSPVSASPGDAGVYAREGLDVPGDYPQ